MVRQGMMLLAAVVFLNSTQAMAQDSEITDKDLYNYALMMQVIEQMKAEVSVAIVDRINMQDGFDTKRYSELSSGGDDAAKLKELGANEFEIKFMTILMGEKDKRTDAINEAVNNLAKNMVGVSTYKAVKSGLSSDADLKAKYDVVAASIAPTGI